MLKCSNVTSKEVIAYDSNQLGKAISIATKLASFKMLLATAMNITNVTTVFRCVYYS